MSSRTRSVVAHGDPRSTRCFGVVVVVGIVVLLDLDDVLAASSSRAPRLGLAAYRARGPRASRVFLLECLRGARGR